jgi:serine/threonine-protein kinase
MNPAPSTPAGAPFTVVGRYAIFDEIASGGMATVHLGRLLGAAGFSRTVAIKKLHPQFARDQEFSTMFVDEARLAARINHPNVVQTLDVVSEGRDLLLVMEYVHGVPFAQLLGASRRAHWRVPPPIVASVMTGALEGLHAAHEARGERGELLNVVHRDVSPQNILVGVEGTARVIDFGVAKAVGKMHATREGQLKGKLAYMSPEQVRGPDVTRVSDVFSAGIVLWEALMGERLFRGEHPAELITQVLSQPIRRPRDKFPDLSQALEEVVMRALEREPAARYATAREMAMALEHAVGVAPARQVADWVEGMAGAALATRAHVLEAIESALANVPAGGEATRIEGLRATLSAMGLPRETEEVDSGREASGADSPKLRSGSVPRPGGREGAFPIDTWGSGPASDPPAQGPLDATNPQGGEPLGPPLPVAPGRALPDDDLVPGLLPALGVRGPSTPLPPRPAEPSAGPTTLPSPPAPAEAAPAEAGSDPLADATRSARPAPTANDGVVRRRPIPIRGEPDAAIDRGSLRAKLGLPITLVVVGVLVSLADVGLRMAGISFAFRPIWVAEVLVIVGVVWAFVALALPSRE